MGRRLATKEYVERAIKKHGGKYTYDNTVYVNGSTKITVTCPIHGDFLIDPENHLYGTAGCKQCGILARAKTRKSRNKFIPKATKLHKGKYDYSKVNYTGLDNPVTIICPIHGEFELTPHSHMTGNGCGMCSGKKKTTKSFIMEARNVHGDRFDYSLVEYDGDGNKITIICPDHGEFETTPRSHLDTKNGGCRQCFVEGMRLTSTDFIARAISTHGNKYTYEKTAYVTNQEKVIITCPVHGDFEQSPFNHFLLGHGCPKCPITISKPHQLLIDKLIELNPEVNDRTVLPSGKELDLWFPEQRIAIEVDGLYYHSTKFKDKFYHRDKYEEAVKEGVRLFQFWDIEVLEKTDIVVSMIKNALGVFSGRRIFARNTLVKELTSEEYHDFLEKSHIQGMVSSKKKLGLYTKSGELVCVMGFTKRKGRLLLDRFASLLDTKVVGGFSKLLSHADIDGPLISHSSNRYSEGALYKTMGFDLINESPFMLHYTDGVSLFSRNKYQKHKLKDMLGYSPEKPADEILLENNIFPVWSSGTKTWELHTSHDGQ